MVESSSDSELRAHALTMWANYIETGNVSMSAQDAAQQLKAEGGRPSFPRREAPKLEVKALDEDQMNLILRLRAMARQELASPTKTSAHGNKR